MDDARSADINRQSRIAFSGLALKPDGSGVQTYIRELLNALVRQATAELDVVVQRCAVPLLPYGVQAIPRPDSKGARRAIQAAKSIDGYDLIHGLDVDLPVRSSCPMVTTVHDLSVFDTPWAFSRFRATGERQLIKAAMKRADEVIAVSSFTADRVAHHFGRPATVIPLAPPSDAPPVDEAAIAAVRSAFDLPDRFVLQLASIEPRKDVDLLAAACAQLDVPLILAGAITGDQTVPPNARHLGYVPARLLTALLDSAEIVAYISKYEGFGLPPLEAMARGRAVVASAVGGLPDVVDGGAHLVPVGDLASLVSGLRQVWSDDDHRSELGRRAAKVAGRLSWDTTAMKTLGVYRRLGVET